MSDGKYIVIAKGLITYAVMLIAWGYMTYIVGMVDNIITPMTANVPQMMTWHGTYIMMWNAFPIELAVIILIYMYKKGNSNEYENNYPRGW
ncbi:hypothetical protein [Methanococcus voltae]|uniref:Uncharacterized protein n=2 Tax=Methanococcus voltae TaxID=2188 RepID=D7DSN8_METV3|nr:hypothetical protein [Methanococcus voltae]MBP2173090.1 hypothetical protein [Methanococcus voltae]MCS3901748.1 hypothetical protein [Methanococcus voltae]MCS3922019.1 hypothetical protein [Methanococcus voltae PS]